MRCWDAGQAEKDEREGGGKGGTDHGGRLATARRNEFGTWPGMARKVQPEGLKSAPDFRSPKPLARHARCG